VTYDEASKTVKIPLAMMADEGDGRAAPGLKEDYVLGPQDVRLE